MAKVASNSMAASDLMVEDKPIASVAENVADRQEIDFDCWRTTVAESVAATFANMLRYFPGATFSDTVIDTAAARVPEDRRVIVAHRTMDRPVTKDGDSAVMAWVAIARCISVASRNKDYYKDCFRLIVRLDKIPRLLLARSVSSRADIAENEPRVESSVAIPERNWTPIH